MSEIIRYRYKWARKANLKVGDAVLSFEDGEKFNVQISSSKKYKVWFDADPTDALKVSQATLDKLLDRCVRLKKKASEVIRIDHKPSPKYIKPAKVKKTKETKFSNAAYRIKFFNNPANMKMVERTLTAYIRQVVSKRKDWEGSGRQVVVNKPSKFVNNLDVSVDVCLSSKPWDCVSMGYSFVPQIAALSFNMSVDPTNPNPKRLLTKKTVVDMKMAASKIEKNLNKKFGLVFSGWETPMWPKLMLQKETKLWYVLTKRWS